MRKKTIINLSILFVGILLTSSDSLVKAQSVCPSVNSINSAILRGRITDTGGDSNIRAWFEWRQQGSSFWNLTPQQNFNVVGVPFDFNYNLSGLNPCTNYEYRAVAQNSAGSSRGEIVCFRTSCILPIRVTCSVSPNPAQINQMVTFSATVSGGQPPYNYTWSGACSSNSSQCITSFSSVGTFTASVTVTDSFGNSQSASCSVNVRAGSPQVITLPPVETL